MIRLLTILKEVMAGQLTKKTEEKRKWRSNGVQTEYLGVKFRKGNKRIRTLEFKSKDDKTGSGNYHRQEIEIPDYRDISKLQKNISLKEKIKLATEAGDINIKCECQDFLYKGYQWMADAGDYGIDKQDIPPNEKNPNLEGSLCKHLHSVLESIDYFYNEIERDFKKYSKQRKQGKR